MVEMFRKFFHSKNCLITGGTGLIGREVARILLEYGASVKVISLDRVFLDDRIEHIYGDLTDFNFCKEHIKDMDYVFHLAGIKGSIKVTIEKPASFFVPLLMFNTNVLEASRLSGVDRLVYTSSIGAYESAEIFIESEDEDTNPPMDMFPGWAKRMAELQIKAYRIQYGLDKYSVVRPCNVYGPGDNFDPNNAMVIPSLMARIHLGENPLSIWGDGSSIRDFAYSKDIAHGVIQALIYGTNGRYVNLGSGTGVTIKELVETLRSFIEFEYYFDAEKPSGFPKRVMDVTLAKKLINYQHNTSLRDGLEATWEWYKKHFKEQESRKNYFIE